MSTIFVCTTCRQPHLRDKKPVPACGEQLAEFVGAAALSEKAVQVKTVACLMGCEHGCNIAISAAGKLSYVLGRFTPDATSAEAIVEYAGKHAESESGVVPFREWPQGVKGHFISRIPSLENEK